MWNTLSHDEHIAYTVWEAWSAIRRLRAMLYNHPCSEAATHVVTAEMLLDRIGELLEERESASG